MGIIDTQESSLRKRVVTLIKNYPQPKEIFAAITTKEYPYSIQYLPAYPIRDRALMALYYTSAGRGAEVCGGRAYTHNQPEQRNNQKELVCIVCGKMLAGSQRKFCNKEHRQKIHSKLAQTLLVRHTGILAENVIVDENKILINEMETVKRSEKVKEKYGPQAILRQPYIIPLKTGTFQNPFWDQLVPFGWLILEYIRKYAPVQGKLFRIENRMAYHIIREVTGNYLNWFRAQGKQFYGKFLFENNAVELAQFVNDKDPKSEMAYTRYDWTTQLKDKSQAMDFDWIEPAIEIIKERL